jgi:hypothetical protein
MTEYIFPKWFSNLPEGIAFIYIFNTVVQISKESNDEISELIEFYTNFPQEEPTDLFEFKKNLNNMVNLCVLCDGYDLSIEDLHLAHDIVIEYVEK